MLTENDIIKKLPGIDVGLIPFMVEAHNLGITTKMGCIGHTKIGSVYHEYYRGKKKTQQRGCSDGYMSFRYSPILIQAISETCLANPRFGHFNIAFDVDYHNEQIVSVHGHTDRTISAAPGIFALFLKLLLIKYKRLLKSTGTTPVAVDLQTRVNLHGKKFTLTQHAKGWDSCRTLQKQE